MSVEGTPSRISAANLQSNPLGEGIVETCLPCAKEGIHGELSGRRRKGLDGGALVVRAWSMGASIEAENDSIPAIATFTARSGDTRAELMVGNRRVESTMVGRGSTRASGGQWLSTRSAQPELTHTGARKGSFV